MYYMRDGQNIGRELAPQVSNPRTPAQMRQRMKWANIVNVYKANRDWMGKLSFENKPQNWSYYNAFMSANLNSDPVYLIKSAAEHGSCILAPYTMTQGTLPRIDYSYAVSIEGLQSNIAVSSHPNIGTIGTLSEEILQNNPEWKLGDQLSFVIMYVDHMGNPIVDAIEIIIDTNDNTSLNDIQCRFAPLVDIITADSGYLQFAMREGVSYLYAAGCLVHSRTAGGKTYVSTQAFELTFDALARFREAGTDEAFNNAAESYGLGSEYFLATDEVTFAAVQDIRSVIYAGTRANSWSDITWTQSSMPAVLTVIMEKPITGTVSLTAGGVSLDATVLGRQVTANVTSTNATAIAGSTAANHKIVVTIGTERYEWA